ncbi:MAG: hypothetical protein HY902_11840 [Deltaproteobacteria bacterium]|nr:hypothetical protein [Deltaproteobacteria bacterium]
MDPCEFAPLSTQAALSELAIQAGRAGSAVHTALADGLAPGSGLQPWAIAQMLAQFARGWRPNRLRRAVAFARAAGARRAVAEVAVIAPANVPAAAWQAVLEPLLAGSRVRVRPSRREPRAVYNLVRALQIVAPDLAERCLISQPTSPHATDWQTWLAGVATLTAQGSDAAMRAVAEVARTAGFAGTLRLHGEMRSLAVIDAAAWRAHGPRLARQLAADALEVDGRGCMSLRTVCWLGFGPAELAEAHALLARALAELARHWPAGGSTDTGLAARTYQLQTLQAVAAVGAPLHLSARSDGWLATAGDRAALAGVWPGPGGRCLVGLSFADSADLRSTLEDWRGQISTAATTLIGRDRAQLKDWLGGPRLCRPGQMQAPRPDQVHDGWAPLQGFYMSD